MSQIAALEVPPKPARPRRRIKLLYRFLWLTLAVVVGGCLYWTWAKYSALAERDALVAELHGKGEPVWWHEVVAKAYADQPEDNGAAQFREALGLIDQASKGFPPTLSQLLDDQKLLTTLFQDDKPNRDVSESLRLAAPGLALLDEAVRKPPGIVTPNLADVDPLSAWLPMMRAARTGLRPLLYFNVHNALAHNDPGGAYRALELMLGCADQLGGEPHYQSFMYGMSLRLVMCACLRECLVYAGAPEREYRRLDHRLAAYDDGLRVGPMFAGERAICLEQLDNDAAMRDLLLNAWGGFGVRDLRGPERWMYVAWLHVLSSPLGVPTRLRTENEFLRFTEQIRPRLDRPDADPDANDAALQAYRRRSPVHQSLNESDNMLREYSLTTGKWYQFAHRRFILTRLALRLRRYYDQHGKFPERLEELCDEAMPKVRLEWFGRQPITYKHSATSFRLEVPKAILQPWEHYHLDKTPIPTEYGLEVELKKYP